MSGGFGLGYKVQVRNLRTWEGDMMATMDAGDVFVFHTWGGSFELRAGDEVGVRYGGVLNRDVAVRRVERVSHKGKRVRLDDGREFNHRNSLVGASPRNDTCLVPIEEARELKDPRRSTEAMVKVLRDISHLADQLARQHGAPLDAGKKTELLALIEQL